MEHRESDRGSYKAAGSVSPDDSCLSAARGQELEDIALPGGGRFRFSACVCVISGWLNIPEALYHYRLHDDSISYKNRTEIQSGYAFAVACARARDGGTAEPEIMTFALHGAKR